MRNYLKLLTVFVLTILPATTIGSATDFEIIKKRVVESLLKSNVDDTKIESLIDQLQEDGTWPGINYEDVSREAFEHRNHLGNMVSLARAYKSKSSGFYQSEKVKEVIESALRHWVENDYICENWWHNQIGTPNNLVTLMLIMGDELPDELVEKTQPMIGRAHVDAPGARPGGDRIKIAGIQAKNSLLVGDSEKFNYNRNAH